MDPNFGELRPLLPGVFGAALAAAMGPQRPLFDRIVGFLVGFGVAIYITEPVMDFFKLAPVTYGSGIGFVLGFFGMTIADALLSLIRNNDWAGMVKQRFGGGGSSGGPS